MFRLIRIMSALFVIYNNVFKEGVYYVLKNSASFLYEKLIAPKFRKEDYARREFILNIILLGILALVLIYVFFVLYFSIKEGSAYKGVDFINMLTVFSMFVSLLFLSRLGFFYLSAYLFVGILLFFSSHTLYQFGVGLPEGLLAYALIIVASSVLISTRFSYIITAFLSILLIVLTYFEINNIIHPRLYWLQEKASISDAITVDLIFAVIAVISWLSNREIERSLDRAHRLESDLRAERDILEIKVQKRTRELQRTQVERINQLAKFIEFGKISSGLFHDLVNHITFFILNLERVAGSIPGELNQTKEYLKQANEAKVALKEYLEATRKQFKDQKIDSLFSVREEIQSVVKIVEHQAMAEKVEVKNSCAMDVLTYGNGVRLNHVITNIICNALDAYGEIEMGGRREIGVNLTKTKDKIIITIEDWAGGMDEETKNKIFEPFFTTKNEGRGTGIGLTTAKYIIEENFGGTIKVKSQKGQGTKFIIEFAVVYEPRSK